MLTTNLLPPSAQKAVRLEEMRRIIQFFASGVAFIIAMGIVIAAAPYPSNIVVLQELKRSWALDEEASMRLGVNGIMARIETINRVLEALKANVSLSSRASRVSDEIFSRTGPGVEIQQLSVRDGEDIAMRGLAATRHDLLAFEKKLRESELFQDISSPLKNIIKETNITFDLQARLKPEFSL